LHLALPVKIVKRGGLLGGGTVFGRMGAMKDRITSGDEKKIAISIMRGRTSFLRGGTFNLSGRSGLYPNQGQSIGEHGVEGDNQKND